ncbi:ABC transporter ATP-binding protein [Caldinitratiruptor microaerophilus]|uniref:ABC transporter ATP-binding protein n=1 Tax=Caldinitratiruptor microaerophilus TaxID=671077 RepID=A0AA35CL00_9FIRM|nr:ABC transporter ATP-binding protein [Caldinitratiruptor microaerophilus]BDG61042.1 ABC transporter ATP-binding protein [Caldinitratiruptor microaerophilus]
MTTPALALRGLTKAFGGLVAVDGLDMAVRPGEVHGLIGPNGSGKSTTLNLISGLLRPTRGQVLLEGRDVTGQGAAARVRLGIARTFQNIRLFRHLTVLDNVLAATYPRTRAGLLAVLARTPAMRSEEEAARRRSLELLDLVGLGRRAADLPGDLPYAQQRLVEIARALATGPRVLLLDEPAAGMNPAEKQELLALIRRLNREFGLTVVLVEHDMSLVMQACDRITVLNFGSRVAEGTPQEVRRHPEVVRAYLGTRFADPAAREARSGA